MDEITTMTCMTLVSSLFDTCKEFIPAYRQFKIRANYDDSIYQKQYTDSMKEHINTINLDNIQEPNYSIVMPALYESLFYLSEEETREMFAKLVASSFNKSKTEFVHPSFINIIKQLSPTDARLLLFINDNKNIKGISAIKDNQEYLLVETNLITDNDDINQINISIENLMRLGLIQIHRKSSLLLTSFINGTLQLDSAEELMYDSTISNLSKHEGYQAFSVNAYITNLGNSFLKVCID